MHFQGPRADSIFADAGTTMATTTCTGIIAATRTTTAAVVSGPLKAQARLQLMFLVMLLRLPYLATHARVALWTEGIL